MSALARTLEGKPVIFRHLDVDLCGNATESGDVAGAREEFSFFLTAVTLKSVCPE